MRVLFDHQIFSSQPQGGVSRYFAELFQGAAGGGFEAVPGWAYTANRYLNEGESSFRDWAGGVSFKGKAHLTGWWNRGVSLRTLKAGRFEVFHPTYYDPYFLEALGDRPFVLTIHDMTHELYPDGLSDRAVTPRRKLLLAQRARKVIAVSENTRQDVIRLLGIDPSRVVTIPHGNSLRPGVVSPREPRVEPGYWLYVGSRSNYKNWAVLVEALSRRANPQDRLVLVGGGRLTEAERRALAAAGLGAQTIQTAASDPELAGWYQNARALVYPSQYEGFGMPLLEAMAWGCPVIAARASCLPEVGGEAVLYFDPGSPQELADRMGEVGRADVAPHLVAAGLAREAGYRWENTVRATAEVYRECL